MERIESIEEDLRSHQADNPETYTKGKENLSELINDLFVNQSMFKIKIINLKYREKDGVSQLFLIRNIGEKIVIITQTIIYNIYNNYELNDDDKNFFSEVNNNVEQLPSVLCTSDYGWNPQETQKIIKIIDKFLIYLQEKDYIRREDKINLKQLINVELENLKNELERRNKIINEISKDIFIEYFDDTIKKIKNEIETVGLKKIKNKLQNIPPKTQKSILKILKTQEKENIEHIEQSIKKIYNEKIKMLPEVDILYMITPTFSKPLIQEQNVFSNKVLELLNSDSYNIKTLHILFTLSNLLISYSQTTNLIQKIDACNKLLSSIGKADQEKKLYSVVMLYLGDIQSTLRRAAAFLIIKC